MDSSGNAVKSASSDVARYRKVFIRSCPAILARWLRIKTIFDGTLESGFAAYARLLRVGRGSDGTMETSDDGPTLAERRSHRFRARSLDLEDRASRLESGRGLAAGCDV